MFEKVMQIVQKTIQRRVQLNTTNFQQTLNNDVEKQLQKEAEKSTPGSSKIPTAGWAWGVEGGTAGMLLY